MILNLMTSTTVAQFADGGRWPQSVCDNIMPKTTLCGGKIWSLSNNNNRRLPSRFYSFEATDEHKVSCDLSVTPQLLGDFGFTYQKEPIGRKNMNKVWL